MCGLGYYFTSTFTGSELVYHFHWKTLDYLALFDASRKRKDITSIVFKNKKLLRWLFNLPALNKILKSIYMEGWNIRWHVGYAQKAKQKIDDTNNFNKYLFKANNQT